MNQSTDDPSGMMYQCSYKFEESEHDSATNGAHDFNISSPVSPCTSCYHEYPSSPKNSNSDDVEGFFLKESLPLRQASLPTTDSVTGADGMSVSFDENNVAYRCQEEWSFHEGEYSRYQIESGLISKEIHIHQTIDEISTISNISNGKKEFTAFDSEEDIWDATFDRIQNYGRSCRLQNHQRKLIMLQCIESTCS